MKITVGLDSLRNYQRMPYELHYALGELVDNAIQAYIDEKKNLKKRLDKEGKKLEIHIHYEPNLDLLRVTDNSTGITKERLSEAFEIGKKIEERDSVYTHLMMVVVTRENTEIIKNTARVFIFHHK